MGRLLLVLFACLASGCAAGASRVSARAAPVRVTAIGVATGIQHVSLARDVAQDRARRKLAMQLTPHAVAFLYRASGEDSALKVSFSATETGMASTEFGKLRAGWICYAHASRTPGDAAAIEKLATVRVQASVQHPDPRISLALAESRAFRAAIAAALGPGAADVQAKGALTLAAMKETVTEEGATVELEAHVRIDERAGLAAAQKPAVIRSALEEHEQSEEWPQAAESMTRLLALTDPAAADHARLGDLYLKASAPTEAAAAFARAAALEPENPAHLRRQLQALEAIPDEVQAARIRKKLEAAETKQNKK